MPTYALVSAVDTEAAYEPDPATVQEPLQVNLSNCKFWKGLATRFQPIPAAVHE